MIKELYNCLDNEGYILDSFSLGQVTNGFWLHLNILFDTGEITQKIEKRFVFSFDVEMMEILSRLLEKFQSQVDSL